MKRFCPLLCLLLLPLSGCAAQKEQKLLDDFSAALNQRQDVALVASLRAVYDDGSFDFRLQYREGPEGPVVTVMEPEELEGLSVTLREDGSLLHYGELHLETGDLDEEGLSPLTALPLLLESLRHPCAQSFRQEGGLLVVSLVPDDERQLDVYFEQETMTPRRAEIVSEGKLRIACEVESWN